jgi:MFS family permease
MRFGSSERTVCGDRCRGYARGVFGRPLSQYVATLSVILVIVGFGLFFVGAAYASYHRDPVRYGALEYLTGPLMLLAFLFFIGLKTSVITSTTAVFLGDDDDELYQRRMQIFRVIGVICFGLGGAILSLATAFFRWFDNGTMQCYFYLNGTWTPPINHTSVAPYPPPPYYPPEPDFLRPTSDVPGRMLVAETVCILVALALAWLSVVFQEQEARLRAKNRGEEVTEEDEGL